MLSFAIDGADVLRRADANAVGEDPLNAACYPCVPYFGRLPNGIDVDGARTALAATHPAIGAIHGDGWISPWDAAERTDERLVCRLAYAPGAPGRWPFAFEATLSFQLIAAGVDIVLSLTNTDRRPAPAGLALHPFFPRRDASRVAFSAGGFWAPPLDGRAGATAPRPDDMGGGALATLPDATRDDTYTGLASDIVVAGGGPFGDLSLVTDAPHLHVYAPAGEAFFCLEPTTHPPGLLENEARLTPGATRRVSMKLAAGYAQRPA